MTQITSSVLTVQQSQPQAAFFAICGSSIQVKQSCVMNGFMAAPVFVSSDSTFVSDGNYINVEELNVARCPKNLPEQPQASVFSETSDESKCFSTTGTGTCNGQCVEGFTESKECLFDNGDQYTLAPQAAPGGSQGNPSCPASPPTPVPTLPPALLIGGPGSAPVSNVGGEPQSTAFGTIPPGNPGAGSPGGSPGSPPGGSGGQVFTTDGGGNSSAGYSGFQRWSQILPIGSALLLATLYHLL